MHIEKYIFNTILVTSQYVLLSNIDSRRSNQETVSLTCQEMHHPLTHTHTQPRLYTHTQAYYILPSWTYVSLLTAVSPSIPGKEQISRS